MITTRARTSCWRVRVKKRPWNDRGMTKDPENDGKSTAGIVWTKIDPFASSRMHWERIGNYSRIGRLFAQIVKRWEIPKYNNLFLLSPSLPYVSSVSYHLVSRFSIMATTHLWTHILLIVAADKVSCMKNVIKDIEIWTNCRFLSGEINL